MREWNCTFMPRLICLRYPRERGARGSVVGSSTMLQAGMSPVRVPDEVDFFNLFNSSSRTMALGSTQHLTEMSTRNLPGSKKRSARRADNCYHLLAECLQMWEPQPLPIPKASTACTRIILPYPVERRWLGTRIDVGSVNTALNHDRNRTSILCSFSS
jgi:hypothetical protein